MQKPSKEIVTVLKRVRERLSKPEAWTQKASARNSAGWVVGVFAEDACSWCLSGAIERETGFAGSLDLETPTRVRLNAFIMPGYGVTGIAQSYGVTGIAQINDAPHRKHEHILKWLDTVIEYDSKALGL